MGKCFIGMIIGNGLVAKGFKKFNHTNYLILASGVSDSLEHRSEEFTREETLVLNAIKEHPKKKVIYISTILIDFRNDPYYLHKRKIENIIKTNAKEYLIFRVPQLVGTEGNPNNVVNYFKDKIKKGQKLLVHEGVLRSLLGVKDLVKIVTLPCILKRTGTMFISGVEFVEVSTICKLIAKALGKPLHVEIRAMYEDSKWTTLNSSYIEEAFCTLKINSEGYTKNLISEYIY